MFKHIHPHARLWFITVIILGIFLIFNPRVTMVSHAPKGTLIAYYDNDYQRYAVEQLIKQNKIEQYPCLYELWTKESNWRPAALNKSSKASGIAQLKPSTWENIKVQPSHDGYAQVLAGLKYIDQHYGKKNSICKAYAHHLALGWY